jgi:hypothetical protein
LKSQWRMGQWKGKKKPHHNLWFGLG